jgi:hypothetical protein
LHTVYIHAGGAGHGDGRGPPAGTRSPRERKMTGSDGYRYGGRGMGGEKPSERASPG